MGYSYRFGTQIQTFWPDDDEKTLYFSSDSYLTVSDMLEQARDHWGQDVKLEDINIGAEHIHTDCLGYDRYDAGDYTNFIVLTRK
jgi:hypothetical protein